MAAKRRQTHHQQHLVRLESQRTREQPEDAGADHDGGERQNVRRRDHAALGLLAGALLKERLQRNNEHPAADSQQAVTH